MKSTEALVLLMLALFYTTPAHAVSFDWVMVGNPDNAGELSGSGTGGFGPDAIVGGVGYTYKISKYEVTNAQYAEFLNAVDPTGANANLGGSDGTLYDASMFGVFGGIANTGTTDGARYIAQPGREQNPVTYVSFLDAMRFTNWLHNGQGSGGTETGAYTIGSGTEEVRSASAKYWIPSEDEWYKAAYYDPSGDTYYDYPTGTDVVPYSDNPASLNTPDDTNVANFYKDDSVSNEYDDGYAVSGSTSFPNRSNPFTDVGAYALATSPYGTFDQGGNVNEWNEAVIEFSDFFRGLRGGAWGGDSDGVRAAFRGGRDPADGHSNVGFRLAGISIPTLPGDFDGNKRVDGADFLAWQRDPSVGQLSDWQANFGAAGLPPGLQPVPEPTNVSLLLLAGTIVLMWQKEEDLRRSSKF